MTVEWMIIQPIDQRECVSDLDNRNHIHKSDGFTNPTSLTNFIICIIQDKNNLKFLVIFQTKSKDKYSKNLFKVKKYKI